MAQRQNVAAQVARYQKLILAGIIAIVCFGGFGAFAVHELRELEAGVRDSARVWAPAAFLYRSFGLWGAAAPFGFMVALGAVFLVGGLRERARLRSTAGAAAVRRAQQSMAAGSSRFVRGTEDSGRLPISTIILGVLLVVLLVGTFAAVKMGLIR